MQKENRLTSKPFPFQFFLLLLEIEEYNAAGWYLTFGLMGFGEGARYEQIDLNHTSKHTTKKFFLIGTHNTLVFKGKKSQPFCWKEKYCLKEKKLVNPYFLYLDLKAQFSSFFSANHLMVGVRFQSQKNCKKKNHKSHVYY